MVRVNWWYPISAKINVHFKKNVWKIGSGPDFREWLLAETGGRIVHVDMEPMVEFATEQELTAFLLKWS